MEFYKKSYDLQSRTYRDNSQEAMEIELYSDWLNGDSVDLWRHMRMLEVLNPFLELDLNANWVTVGDGRYGTAAIYINKRGGLALATDIDDTLLVEAVKNGMINDYRKENAESLSFSDNRFDYSFCKEAFHHFPRPFIALYEMLRCSRKAVLFTEPKEWRPAPIPLQLLSIFKRGIKLVFGLKNTHPDSGSYESVGNYIYCISKREFEKVALALNLPCVAYKEFHDIYIDGVEKERISGKSSLYTKIKRKLFANKIMSKLGLSGMNRISYILFKEAPAQKLRDRLSETGFKIIDLPQNPFI